jgi:hypothetical protein
MCQLLKMFRSIFLTLHIGFYNFLCIHNFGFFLTTETLGLKTWIVPDYGLL